MANPEHVEIVKKGTNTIQEWRRANPDTLLDLSEANLFRIDLHGADLGHALLDAADLNSANLAGADLSCASLRIAILIEADLTRARLCHADLSLASLVAANLDGCDMSHADLRIANLAAANLTGADLTSADLRMASFFRAKLVGADLTNAECENTVFASVDLSGTLGLDSIRHTGPSAVALDVLMKTANAHIPVEFLRGCGVPDSIISLVPNLIALPGYHTCFISFTETDDGLSHLLYDELQTRGVRCWRWKEDAKWGRTLMAEVDDAVSSYDKLIVICSEFSLNSPAVLREIERALQKEDQLVRQGKPSDVLFPIRVDDYLFDAWEHPRKADVIAKCVGDFREWKDPKAYAKALDRLVRDLRAEPSSNPGD
jgi:hypothetical protein